MKLKLLILVCVLAAVVTVFGCAPAKAPTAKVAAGYERIRIVGGTTGSMSGTAAIALATLLNRYYPDIEWSSCSGATAINVAYLTKGTIQVGMIGFSAYIDTYGYDKIAESTLRTVCVNGPVTAYVFFIPEDKPWTDITDVPKGANLCPGSAGTTIPVCCEAWLRLCGLSKKDFNWLPLSRSEMVDAWKAGKLDVIFATAQGAPPWLYDVNTSPRKVKLMGMTPEHAAKAKAEQSFERLGWQAPSKSIVAKSNPEFFKYDVLCVHAPFFFGTRDDFPGEIAYGMAKTIDEHNTEFAAIYAAMKYVTPEWHIKGAKPPMDIHPGVAKYYNEKGYLK